MMPIFGFSLLANHPRVKKDSIHIFGFSRGGIMALWTAIEYPAAASMVTWGGVSDMFLTYEERVDMRRMMKRVIGGSPTKCPEHYESRTPLSAVGRLATACVNHSWRTGCQCLRRACIST